MRFLFDPLSRAFSNRCVFDENAQRISVDVRPKRIEMYGFSSFIKPEKVLRSLQLWPYSRGSGVFINKINLGVQK